MPNKDTPPASPYSITNMESDEEEIFEEELELVLDADGEDPYGLAEGDEDTDDDQEDDGEAIKDDAAYVFRSHQGSVFCCHLEPRLGNLAVTGGEDDKAYVWETRAGNVMLECNGHKDSVTCAEFSRDGSYLATGDMSGVLQVWKMSNKTLVWDTNIGDLVWIKWHHGTNVLLAGGESGDVYVWRIPSGECKVLPGTGSRAECGVIMPDGKRAVVGYLDDSIKVFDMKAASVVHHLRSARSCPGSISCMDAHPDNNLVIVGSCSDSRIVLLSTQTGKVVAHLDCVNPRPDAGDSGTMCTEVVAFSRDGNLPLAATGHVGGSIFVWDIGRQIPRHVFWGNDGLSSLVWDKSSPLLYAAGLNGKIRMIDCRSGTEQAVLSGHRGHILGLSLSSDGSTLLTASDDTTARVFTLTALDR